MAEEITRGNWITNISEIAVDVQEEKSGFGIVCLGSYRELENCDYPIDMAIANAKLIADAGTTYNKCGKKPSELLEANKELLEALKEFISLSEDSDMRPEDECIELHHKYLELIKKHEQ